MFEDWIVSGEGNEKRKKILELLKKKHTKRGGGVGGISLAV